MAAAKIVGISRTKRLLAKQVNCLELVQLGLRKNETSDCSSATEIFPQSADQILVGNRSRSAGICAPRNFGPQDGQTAAHSGGRWRVGNQFWIVAEHGVKAGYVRNIQTNPRVRLKLREGVRARWHEGMAHVLYDDNARERQRWLAGQLPSSAANARVVRLLGTRLLTVRIDLDE
jgi:hypothetical protein